MMNLEDLRNIGFIRNVNDITLELLAQHYESELLPYIFKYEVRDGEPITVSFERSNFAHLIGLQYISRTEDFRGMKAWDRIMDGSLTMENIKKSNDKEAILSRIRNFPIIPMVLANPFV